MGEYFTIVTGDRRRVFFSADLTKAEGLHPAHGIMLYKYCLKIEEISVDVDDKNAVKNLEETYGGLTLLWKGSNHELLFYDTIMNTITTYEAFVSQDDDMESLRIEYGEFTWDGDIGVENIVKNILFDIFFMRPPVNPLNYERLTLIT